MIEFEIIECKSIYGGLDTNISIIYIDVSNYNVYSLVMDLDSIQEEMLRKSTNKDSLISSLVNKFHYNSKKMTIDEIKEENLTHKLRDYKIYEILK
jgi:hypothetical protein